MMHEGERNTSFCMINSILTWCHLMNHISGGKRGLVTKFVLCCPFSRPLENLEKTWYVIFLGSFCTDKPGNTTIFVPLFKYW